MMFVNVLVKGMGLVLFRLAHFFKVLYKEQSILVCILTETDISLGYLCCANDLDVLVSEVDHDGMILISEHLLHGILSLVLLI